MSLCSLSKHLDTLFRITHSSNFNTSIQALMLIQQLSLSHQVAADRFYRTLYESLLDPRVATSSKQALYLNLLYKALKNDLNVRRVKAFVKRIVQILGLHQPSFTCGILYLIRELENTYSGLQSLFDQPEENENDQEEVFRDVPDEDDGEQDRHEAPQPSLQKPSGIYDPRKRDPEHSNAERTCLWELLPYLSHFHPSVSVNAAQLLDHQPMSGKPDLSLHTLSHFLDRFVYRTPKANSPVRGASIMQPLAGADASDRLVTSGRTDPQTPVNLEAFWSKKADQVSAEDAFFHEYFTRIGKESAAARKNKKRVERDPVDRDEEGVEGSDDESEIWKALVESRPELEADEESDDDVDFDDFESAMGEGDDEGVIFNETEDIDEEDGDDEGKPMPTLQKQTEASDSDEDDNFNIDDSDEEAFINSDEDLPLDMDVGEVESPAEESKPAGSSKKRKLKHLPMFASAEDYAELLAGEDEGI